MRNGETKLITFRGQKTIEVKRKMIGYWYEHRHCIHLTLREFLDRCSPIESDDSSSMTYYATESSLAEDDPPSPYQYFSISTQFTHDLF